MVKMESNGSGGDSMKDFAKDEMAAIVEKLKIEEKESNAQPTDVQCVEPNVTVNEDEKKNLSLDVTNEGNKLEASSETDRKPADDIESKNKDDSKLLEVIDKNKQNEDKADKEKVLETKKEEMQDAPLPLHPKDESLEKDSNNEDSKDLPKGGYALKRKRRTSNLLDVKKEKVNSPLTVDSPMEESGTRSKRKKLKNTNDRFCWRCHKEPADVHCTACLRAWHRKCIGGAVPSLQKWICGECATILRAENAETRSTTMAHLSVDQLCMLLKHVVTRLREYPGAEPFCKPVDLDDVTNYLDYVIKPMDLSLLESNVRAKLYGSTDAFMADAKWIQHNCIVFNTYTSKLTNTSKQLIKVARQEVSEIEACPDCYAHGRNLPRPQPSWFIEPCRRPHPLVWAKLKGFPFWPAKAMPRLNSQGYVDVRFFGEHDRAWVPPKDLYLYSEEAPAPSSRKKKSNMDECVREITRHCQKLELMFGKFNFAPPKTQYNPNDPLQITVLLPNYNPLEPNSHLLNNSLESTVSKKKMPLRKRGLKDKSQNDEESTFTDEDGMNASLKGNVNSNNHEMETDTVPTKVQKLSSEYTKNTSNLQSNISGNRSKSNKRESQELVTDSQNNKVVKDKARRSRTPSIKASAVGNSNTSNRNNSQKTKGQMKSVTENLSKLLMSSLRHQDREVARVRTKSLLKNIINPKQDVSQNRLDNVTKSTQKKGATGKVYKPKTRMVDKLNAEKVFKLISASKENDELTTSSELTDKRITLISNNTRQSTNTRKASGINTTLSPTASDTRTSNKIETRAISSMNSHASTVHSSDKLSVTMNNKTTVKTKKQQASTIVADNKKDAIRRETTEAGDKLFQKKESKAKKTFPYKSHSSPRVNQRSLPTNVNESPISSSNPETSCDYQLVPPEAGPISARLHLNAHELARRMGQMLEEAYKEAAEANCNNENGTADNYQATIFFLRMQIEHMKWQQQQQIAELKHNADRTMREMRASLEAEKLRLVEEIRRKNDEDKNRCIEETKRKQWCARCGKEALFYCCWNTAYCDYPCQQFHWSKHMRTCSQQSKLTTIVTTNSTNTNSQVQLMPKLVFNANSDVWKS